MNLNDLTDPTIVGTPVIYLLACLFGVGTITVALALLLRRHYTFLPQIHGGPVLALGLFLFGLSGLAQMTINGLATNPPTYTELGNPVPAEYYDLGVLLFVIAIVMVAMTTAYIVLSIMLANNQHAPSRAWGVMCMATGLLAADLTLCTYERAKTALGRIETDDIAYLYQFPLWVHWAGWALTVVVMVIAAAMLARIWRKRRARREHLEYQVI